MRVYIPGAPNDGAYAGICFGGSSDSNSSQQTANNDNRVGADSGAIVAQGGSKVTQINASSDPAVLLEALHLAALTNGDATALASVVATQGLAVGAHAIDAGADVAKSGLAAGVDFAHDAQSQEVALLSGALSIVGQSDANNVALAQQALQSAQPAQALLKMILTAGAVVAVFFFLARGR